MFLSSPQKDDRLDRFEDSMGQGNVVLHLAFENQGSGVRDLAIISRTGVSLENMGREIPVGMSGGWIQYPYVRSRKGKKDRFTISFETYDGHKLKQVYELVHGDWSLRRIKPS